MFTVPFGSGVSVVILGALSVVSVSGSEFSECSVVDVSAYLAMMLYVVAGVRPVNVVDVCQVVPLFMLYSAPEIGLIVILFWVLDNRVGASGVLVLLSLASSTSVVMYSDSLYWSVPANLAAIVWVEPGVRPVNSRVVTHVVPPSILYSAVPSPLRISSIKMLVVVCCSTRAVTVAWSALSRFTTVVAMLDAKWVSVSFRRIAMV